MNISKWCPHVSRKFVTFLNIVNLVLLSLGLYYIRFYSGNIVFRNVLLGCVIIMIVVYIWTLICYDLFAKNPLCNSKLCIDKHR